MSTVTGCFAPPTSSISGSSDVPGREVAAVRRPLVEDRERLAEGQVLAEGEQVLLVVAARDRRPARRSRRRCCRGRTRARRATRLTMTAPKMAGHADAARDAAAQLLLGTCRRAPAASRRSRSRRRSRRRSSRSSSLRQIEVPAAAPRRTSVRFSMRPMLACTTPTVAAGRGLRRGVDRADAQDAVAAREGHGDRARAEDGDARACAARRARAIGSARARFAGDEHEAHEDGAPDVRRAA